MAGNMSISLFLAFLMASASAQAFEWRELFQPKIHVVIVNDLPGGAPLSFGCHSRQGDLGHYTLHKGGSQEISFYAAFWGGELIVTCDFYWGRNQRRSFDIFAEVNDSYRCERTCRLHIEPRGPFYYAEVVVEKNFQTYKTVWLKVPFLWK